MRHRRKILLLSRKRDNLQKLRFLGKRKSPKTYICTRVGGTVGTGCGLLLEYGRGILLRVGKYTLRDLLLALGFLTATCRIVSTT